LGVRTNPVSGRLLGIKSNPEIRICTLKECHLTMLPAKRAARPADTAGLRVPCDPRTSSFKADPPDQPKTEVGSEMRQNEAGFG
jgi:hypothetical protein